MGVGFRGLGFRVWAPKGFRVSGLPSQYSKM